MSAREATNALQHSIFTRTGVSLGFDDANTLRRAQLTLHRWAELECGDGNAYTSWAIERDEETGVPFLVYHRFTQPHPERVRIADREAGALRRVKDVCVRNGLHYYHQTDPRGCALYVAAEALTDYDYSRGVGC